MATPARVKDLWFDQDGITTVEYALLLALVFIASVSAWSTLGGTKMRMTAEAVARYVDGSS
jgi:Flp pilus assembly pilin Flp